MRDHAGRGDSPAGVLAPPLSAHAPPRGDSYWLRCVEGRGRGDAVRLPAERARSPAAAAVAAPVLSAPRSLRRRLCQRHRVPAALCLLTARRSLVFVLTDFWIGINTFRSRRLLALNCLHYCRRLLSNVLQGWAQHLELWKWTTIPRESCSSLLSTRSEDTPVSSGLMTRPSVNPLFRESTSSMRLSQQKCVNSLRNMRVSYQTLGWRWAFSFCKCKCAVLSVISEISSVWKRFWGFLFMYFDVVWGRLWRCRVEMPAMVFGLTNSIRVELLCWW